jgi:UbiD family decarboxylase
VGQDPLLTILGGSGVFMSPAGVSELGIAGYVRGSPYPIVRGPRTGLPMPAQAEIAIEGLIPPPSQRLEPEGPFGEWTGYYAHGRRPETVVEVTAVYYRDDPIIFGLPPSRPLGARYNRYLGADDIDAMLKVERAGIPGVQRIYQLGKPDFRVVAVKQAYAGHLDDLIRVLVPGGELYHGHQIWVFVDDDVDVTNSDEVIWALATRCAPDRGVRVVPAQAVWQLDPRVAPQDRSDPEEGGRKRYSGDCLVLDACRPYEWFNEFPPVAVNSEEVRRRVRTKWAWLFE